MRKKRELVDRDTPVEEVIRRYPGTIPVFERRGLRCAGCRAALFENVEQGAKIQGIDVDALIAELNAAISEDRLP